MSLDIHAMRPDQLNDLINNPDIDVAKFSITTLDHFEATVYSKDVIPSDIKFVGPNKQISFSTLRTRAGKIVGFTLDDLHAPFSKSRYYIPRK